MGGLCPLHPHTAPTPGPWAPAVLRSFGLPGLPSGSFLGSLSIHHLGQGLYFNTFILPSGYYTATTFCFCYYCLLSERPSQVFIALISYSGRVGRPLGSEQTLQPPPQFTKNLVSALCSAEAVLLTASSACRCFLVSGAAGYLLLNISPRSSMHHSMVSNRC